MATPNVLILGGITLAFVSTITYVAAKWRQIEESAETHYYIVPKFWESEHITMENLKLVLWFCLMMILVGITLHFV